MLKDIEGLDRVDTAVPFGAPLMHVPWGLCGNRDEHKPHLVLGEALGDFFCTARQQDRLPYAAERRRNG